MAVLGSSPLSVWRPIPTDKFLLGAPHYPEHVDESYWERDAERIAAAGFNTVRMGEFAWHIFEPRENLFDFELFDKAIAVLGRYGVNTILCTPTATPPRWLTTHYPEVLRLDENGRLASHGSRQHADTCSPVFRMHSKRITRAMAAHYKTNPHVVGWQTDNELNTTESTSYAAATRREFQKFLEGRYKTIKELNFAWGGDFWATAYDNFDQIVLPLNEAPGFLSPGHVQDFHRFLAFATARFQHDQVEILRDVNPDWFIFHNLGELADIDFRGQFSKDLDFIGYDVYPLLYDEVQRIGGSGIAQAWHLDTCRAFAGNFIVPEQQSGIGSQPMVSTMNSEPGEMRRMAISSIAHGADGVMFFRWRPAHFGAEIYWMGIIDHDDIPRRRYAEAKRFAQEIGAIKDRILGTHVRMDVGIAGADFDNQEAHRTYPMGLPSPADDGISLYAYCHRRGIACGYIHPDDDLSRLKVLYVPHWLIWKPEWTAKLEAFAHNGGTVILSARTGTRDENNHIHRVAAPGGGLSQLAGVTVEEFGRIGSPHRDGLFQVDNHSEITGGRKCHVPESSLRQYDFIYGNRELTAAHMYELLSPADGTEILAKWSSRFCDGLPAITSRQVGQGQVVYVGTYLTDEFVEVLVDDLFSKSAVAPLVFALPEGVEVTMRKNGDRELLFVMNTRDEPVGVDNVPEGRDLLGGSGPVSGRLELETYGCAILQIGTTD